jgi:hypothetical protein
MRESSIEKAVCKWAKEQGILVMKLAGPQQKGQPDRMFLHKGRVGFLEFKAPGKKPTALQENWLEELWNREFPVGWFDNVADAVAWLKKHML